ncbi:MAG: hypothetical protein DRP23_01100 [Thermotogae bacterium]|nr:MAG: hypothetical protein DRP23_01100 [Thermotogota bacterium]
MFGITPKRIIIIVAIFLLLAYFGKLGDAVNLLGGIVNGAIDWSKDRVIELLGEKIEPCEECLKRCASV